MKSDYGAVYRQSRTKDTRSSREKFTSDKAFDEFLQDFNKKFKIDETKKKTTDSFSNQYKYYKDLLEDFKDRKKRSSSRQQENFSVNNRSHIIQSDSKAYRPEVKDIYRDDRSWIKKENSVNILIINYQNYKKRVSKPKQTNRENRIKIKSPPKVKERTNAHRYLPKSRVSTRYELKYEDSYSVPVYSGSCNRGEDYSNDEGVEEDSAKRIAGWKQTEDQKLLYLVQKYPDNWAKIAKIVENHDKDDCRRRYNKLTTSIHIGKWSEEETSKLLHLYKLYGNNWKIISDKLPGRTQEQIKDKVRTIK